MKRPLAMSGPTLSGLTLSGLSLLAASGWKWIFAARGKVPFNSDEAVIGLMARHILAGARPVFFYGQNYMGSLDAWLAAAGFAVFGPHVWVIRLVQTLLYLGVIATSIAIVRRITCSWRPALVSGLLLAFPTINLFLYTTASLGGYNEALLIGNALILLAIELLETQALIRSHKWRLTLFAWAFLAGLGFWSQYLTAVYIIPLFLMMAWKAAIKGKPETRKAIVPCVLTLLAGFLLGSAPLWTYAIRQGFGVFSAGLFRFAFSSGGGLLLNILAHARNLLLFGLPVILGFRPPWSVQLLVLPLLPAALVAWGILGWRAVRTGRSVLKQHSFIRLLLAVAVFLLLAYVLTSFGNDPSGRYFLPFSVLLAMGIGILISREKHWVFSACAGVLVIFNVSATFQCALKEPHITTQFTAASTIDHSYDDELIAFLQAHDARYGYSNYWVTYPLAFKTGEQVLFVPVLPYQSDLDIGRDDKYKPFSRTVSMAVYPAYITTRQPDLNRVLREAFESRGAAWKEHEIGDYYIFYDLSKTIRPDDIGSELCTYGIQDYCP